MKQYNILINYITDGYNVRGNIFVVLIEILKNPRAKITITEY